MNQDLCYDCGGKIVEWGGARVCPACGMFASEDVSKAESALLEIAYRKLRFSKFFDAEQDFEDIICKYPQSAHGYWGRLLAKYYVKYESSGGKKLPVCYAPSRGSVYDDEDYRNTLKYADEKNKGVFEDHAKRIDSFCKEWTEKVSREDPYDIFICYRESATGVERTQDSVEAQALYEHLTKCGYRVFYGRESLRDKDGKRFEPYLYVYGAIATAKIMVLYGTNVKYITSPWMKNEWSRYQKHMFAGEKAPDSLLVACGGFPPAALPGALVDMPCLDAKKSAFYDELTDRISILLHETPSENGVTSQDICEMENAVHPSPDVPTEDVAVPSDELCQHVPNVIPGKEPTCKAAGWTESAFCKICGKTLRTLEWIPATDHVFGEWRVAKKPTCTKEGEEESVCACGERKTRPIPVTDHSFGEWRVAKKATCTKEGREESVCACGEKKTRPIPATGHVFGEWRVSKKATCAGNGEEESVCACGERKTRSIPATGHSFGEWHVAKKATCTEDGAYERVCACGKKESKVIPSRGGHITDGTWKTIRKAMPGKDGLKAQTCIICGEHVTEEKLPALASQGLKYSPYADKKSCTIIGIGACQDKDIVIPESIDGYTVTAISSKAFEGNRMLKSVLLSASIRTIGDWAFSNCSNLMNITFSKSLTSIGAGAFWGCSSLKSVSIPQSVRSIGNYSFRYCRGLTSVSLPSSLESIPSEMFESCEKLLTIMLPSTLKTVGMHAFKGCVMLSSVYMSSSLQRIGNGAFLDCRSLRSLNMPSSLCKIEDSAFEGCTALTKVTAPNGMPYHSVSIGANAFLRCLNLTEMGLLKSASSIGESAFSSCEKLSDVCVSSYLTDIASKAFSGCKNLASIRYIGTKAQWKKVTLDRDWRKEFSIRSIECEGGMIKFLFS